MASSLRLATKADVPSLLVMAEEFHIESPYSRFPIDREKYEQLVLSFVQNDPSKVCVVLHDDDLLMGMIAGHVQELLFGKQRIASEVVWYVYPNFRNGTGGVRLRKAFEYWAENVVKADIVHMASLNNEHAEKLKTHYEKKGYKLFEMTYLKEVNQWQQ